MDHIAHWIFDLDNTLYPPEIRLFDQIEAKMEHYITRELGLDSAAANDLRADFWHNHGTTLAGLMSVYNIDPDPFLTEVHDIDITAIPRDPVLADAISALPGQRLIYTNGSRWHGENISTARGVRPAFHAVYGIEDAGYVPKPHRDAFEAIVAKADIDPTRAVMIEDDPRNLKIPAEMGMTTILVGPPHDAPHIQHQTEDLAGLLSRLMA